MIKAIPDDNERTTTFREMLFSLIVWVTSTRLLTVLDWQLDLHISTSMILRVLLFATATPCLIRALKICQGRTPFYCAPSTKRVAVILTFILTSHFLISVIQVPLSRGIDTSWHFTQLARCEAVAFMLSNIASILVLPMTFMEFSFHKSAEFCLLGIWAIYSCSLLLIGSAKALCLAGFFSYFDTPWFLYGATSLDSVSLFALTQWPLEISGLALMIACTLMLMARARHGSGSSFCPQCGYDRRGIHNFECPECGTPARTV